MACVTYIRFCGMWVVATSSWHHIFRIFFQEPSSVEKIMEIDEHIGCAMSGLIADARTLVEHARVETQVP